MINVTSPTRITDDQGTMQWIIEDGGALDIDNCPDCWERRAHIERYEFACKALTGMRVLDFGCGTGYGSEMLLLASNKVVGVDTSKTALNIAKSLRVTDPNLIFTERGWESIPFDACTAFEVIEHLDNPAEFISTVNTRHLIASVPVVPTVSINKYHKTDFTVDSFKNLLETRFKIVSWWIQVMPFHNQPSVAIFHGEVRN